MKPILILIAFLLSWLVSGAALRAGTPENLHLYLLIGQSNMAGRAAIEAEDEAPVDRAFLFDSEEEWTPAANPLNRYSSVRKRLDMQRLNLGYTFARRMSEFLPEANIGLVVNARGGTRIEAWAEGGELYREAVERTKRAMRSGMLQGILWHQGEGNSSDPEYLEKLSALISALRRDLETPDLPFVAGQVAADGPVNLHLAKLPERVSATSCVSSAGLTTFDGTHFDSASLREFGRRYAAETIRLQEQAQRAGKEISLFDGETFAGWEGAAEEYVRIEDGAIVCGLADRQVPHNQFLSTTRGFRNFELRLKFKLIGAENVNSGVQIRSWRIPNHYATIGYQADLGNPGWWGSLYDEHRRNRVLAQSDMEKLRPVLRIGDWNHYTIRAEGKRIRLWINKLQTVDYTEEEEGVAESGVLAVQIHSMAPGEAWFKDLVIRELP